MLSIWNWEYWLRIQAWHQTDQGSDFSSAIYWLTTGQLRQRFHDPNSQLKMRVIQTSGSWCSWMARIMLETRAGIHWKDITRPQESTTGGLHEHKPLSASGSRKPGAHSGSSSDHLFFIKGPTGTPPEVMCAGSVVKCVLEAGKDGISIWNRAESDVEEIP